MMALDPSHHGGCCWLAILLSFVFGRWPPEKIESNKSEESNHEAFFFHVEMHFLARQEKPITTHDDQHVHHIGTMDYEGQRLSELLFYWIILAFGAVGWVIGYFKQDFTVVFHFWLVGVAISVVVCESIYCKLCIPTVNFRISLCSHFKFLNFLSFAFQIGHSTIDTLSNGLNLYQIEEGKNEVVCEEGSQLVNG